jgi:hypothetical protein
VLVVVLLAIARRRWPVPSAKKQAVTDLDDLKDKTHEVVTLPWTDGLVVNIRLRKINILKALVSGNFPNRLLQHFMGSKQTQSLPLEDGDLAKVEAFYESIAKASMVEPSFEQLRERMTAPGAEVADIPMEFFVGIVSWQSGGTAAVDSFRRNRRA